jgi:hypothetical protein
VVVMLSIVKEIASVWILYLDGNLGEDLVALCGFFLSVYAVYVIYSHDVVDEF